MADREALTRLPGNIEFAGGRAVEHRVANKHVATLGCFRARADGDGSTGKAFADIIVGFAGQTEVCAGDEEGSKALSRGSDEFTVDAAQLERRSAQTAKDFTAEVGANRTVGIGDAKTIATRRKRFQLFYGAMQFGVQLAGVFVRAGKLQGGTG